MTRQGHGDDKRDRESFIVGLSIAARGRLCNNSLTLRIQLIHSRKLLPNLQTAMILSNKPTPRRTTRTGHTLRAYTPVVICLALASGGLSHAADGLASGGADLSAPNGGPILLAPFKYIPSIGVPDKTEPDAVAPKRSEAQQRILDLNAAGNYQAIAQEGSALLAKDKPDDELQLIFANSLAWTGRLQSAVLAYDALSKGKYANEATLGMANADRWMGRDDLALPLYKDLLGRDPGNADALEGLELVTRELRPRTAVSFGDSGDSSNMQRQSATVSHRWRGNDGSTITEIETSGVKDTLPASQAKQQDVTVRYQDLGLSLKPSIELSMPTNDDHSLYSSLKFSLNDNQETIEIGKVNWGRLANNADALASHLSASHIALTTSRFTSLGRLSGRIDYYDISDGNSILGGRLYFHPAWRPLGTTFKPFVSMESRQAKFNTSKYWSPADGSVSMYAGMLGDWGTADWNLFISGQYGVGLSGEAGNGWGLSAGGKRWLANDLALSMSLWSMSTWRDRSNYRAQSATVILEKLWR